MATAPFMSSTRYRRPSLAEIDALVSARLGAARVPGNAQPACFNRQVAMYLAKHVGGWSTTLIGRFYNDRDHSTVCHGIQRIESLRESDPDIDILLTELKDQLCRESDGEAGMAQPVASCGTLPQTTVEELADLVVTRVCAYLEARIKGSGQSNILSQSPKIETKL